MITSLISVFTMIIEVLLAFRIIFRLFGASEISLVDLVYRLSDPLVAPFVGLVAAARYGQYLVEWSSIIALFVYGLVSFLLMELIAALTVRFRR